MAIDFRKFMSAEDLEKADRRAADIKARSVTIKGYVDGLEKDLLVGHQTYPDGKMVYGLMDDVYGITHRCYLFDMKFIEKLMSHKDSDFWYFDAGHSCSEIKVSIGEVRRSLQELNLLDKHQ